MLFLGGLRKKLRAGSPELLLKGSLEGSSTSNADQRVHLLIGRRVLAHEAVIETGVSIPEGLFHGGSPCYLLDLSNLYL